MMPRRRYIYISLYQYIWIDIYIYMGRYIYIYLYILYLYRYIPPHIRNLFSISIDNTRNHVATLALWVTHCVNMLTCRLIDNVGGYLYFKNGRFKVQIGPHHFNLRVHHFSQFPLYVFFQKEIMLGYMDLLVRRPMMFWRSNVGLVNYIWLWHLPVNQIY